MLLAGLLFVASSNPARSYEVRFNASGDVFLRQPIQSLIVNVAGEPLAPAEQAALTAKVGNAINTWNSVDPSYDSNTGANALITPNFTFLQDVTGWLSEGVVFHRSGVYEFVDGTSYSGKFENGIPDGRGTFHDPEGVSYEGEFVGGLRHGIGVCLDRTEPNPWPDLCEYRNDRFYKWL